MPLRHQAIGDDAALHQLPAAVRPYFFCIEALQQSEPGRYLYVDADTLCVNPRRSTLSEERPLAAASHGRPMPDRALLFGLETSYHYFNAGVLLFDSSLLAKLLTYSVVQYFLRTAPSASASSVL